MGVAFASHVLRRAVAAAWRDRDRLPVLPEQRGVVSNLRMAH